MTPPDQASDQLVWLDRGLRSLFPARGHYRPTRRCNRRRSAIARGGTRPLRAAMDGWSRGGSGTEMEWALLEGGGWAAVRGGHWSRRFLWRVRRKPAVVEAGSIC